MHHEPEPHVHNTSRLISTPHQRDAEVNQCGGLLEDGAIGPDRSRAGACWLQLAKSDDQTPGLSPQVPVQARPRDQTPWRPCWSFEARRCRRVIAIRPRTRSHPWVQLKGLLEPAQPASISKFGRTE
jgi:hypothetical protein